MKRASVIATQNLSSLPMCKSYEEAHYSNMTSRLQFLALLVDYGQETGTGSVKYRGKPTQRIAYRLTREPCLMAIFMRDL